MIGIILHDYLNVEKYDNPNQSLKKEALSVSNTKNIKERDFGMLDRLI